METNGVKVVPKLSSENAEVEKAREAANARGASAPSGHSRLRPSPQRLVIAFASVYLIWGSTYLGIKIAIETIPPFLMAGMRFTIAGAVLYWWMLRRGTVAPSRAQWRSASIIGALLFLGGNGALTWAEL